MKSLCTLGDGRASTDETNAFFSDIIPFSHLPSGTNTDGKISFEELGYLLRNFSNHNIPRNVPKDITTYYTDGSLWSRIAGTDGYSLMEDIYVGDFFQMQGSSAAKTGDGRGI